MADEGDAPSPLRTGGMANPVAVDSPARPDGEEGAAGVGLKPTSVKKGRRTSFADHARRAVVQARGGDPNATNLAAIRTALNAGDVTVDVGGSGRAAGAGAGAGAGSARARRSPRPQQITGFAKTTDTLMKMLRLRKTPLTPKTSKRMALSLHRTHGSSAAGSKHTVLDAFDEEQKNGPEVDWKIHTSAGVDVDLAAIDVDKLGFGRDKSMETDHTMKYVYGVVLKNKVRSDGTGLSPERLRHLQQTVVEIFTRSHLKFVLLADDPDVDTDRKLVILIEELAPDMLVKEAKRLAVDEFLVSGEEPTLLDADDMTPADKLMFTHRIVDRCLSLVRDSARYFREIKDHNEANPIMVSKCGRQVPAEPISWERDVVVSAGPLHDITFNNHFFTKFMKWNTFTTWDLDTLINSLRAVYGERVAFYYFFIDHYTKWLIPLMAILMVWYILTRFLDWGIFVRGLGILGFLVPSLWGQLFSISWRRKTAHLLYVWGVSERAIPDVPNPNNPEYKFEYNPHTHGQEKVFDPKGWRNKITMLIPFFTVFNMALLCFVATPFIQWYVFSKLVPTCECCEWYHSVSGNLSAPMTLNDAAVDCVQFKKDTQLNIALGDVLEPEECRYFINCFNAAGGVVGTDRWVYIVVQGILLGIILDVVQIEFFVWATEKVTKKESWPTEASFESNLIHKQYLFCWFNMFFWFLWIGYVYVPFGRELQDALKSLGLGWSVPGFGWRAGVVNIDEAFVTPLVATAAINLTLETLIPWLMNKQARKLHERQRALKEKLHFSKSGRLKSRTLSDATAEQKAGHEHEVEAAEHKEEIIIPESGFHTPRTLARWMSSTWQKKLKIVRYTDDSNRYDATEVVLQLSREPFHPRKDYLDMMMQFGYVSQFCVAWALAPLPAVVNNLLEIRGDVLKMVTGHSRPVPVRERGAGEWEKVIDRGNTLATIVVIGFIVVGTGSLEWWATANCIEDTRNAELGLMTPDLDCFDQWGYRMLTGLVLYIIALFIKHYVHRFYPVVEPEIEYILRSEAEVRQRRRMDRMLPQLPTSFAGHLRVVFEHYDESKDGVLQPEECIPMFDELNRISRELAVSQGGKLPRKLAAKDHEALFEILDADNSQCVGFAEAAMAISRCSDDPLLGDAIGFSLEEATKLLADRILAEHHAGKDHVVPHGMK